jgi:hypothetical protein
MTADGADNPDANPRGCDDTSGRRRLFIALAAVALLAAVGVVIAATTTYPIGSGTTFETDSGVTLHYGTSDQQVTGNPFTPRTYSNDAITFAGANSEARIDALNASGTWTNLSQVNVQQGPLHVNRSDSMSVGVRGTVDNIDVSAVDLDKTNDSPEIEVSAGGDWTMQVKNTGLSQGTGIVVRDPDTGDVLDAAGVLPNGTARFDDLTSVSNEPLNIEQGPSELVVYNASDPTQLADGVTLTVRVFDQSGEVFERQVSGGTMDLTGIPKNQPLTITVQEDSTTRYVYRRTVIESVSEQQEVYLLSSANTEVANVIFSLDDRTGRYNSEETVLFVKRPVTKDFDGDGQDETRYQNVVGDTFGTGSFPTILEVNQRYRLIVQNDQGDRRVIGSYVAQLDDRATVRIGNVEFRGDGSRAVSANLRAFQEDTDGDNQPENFTRFVYIDNEDRTERIEWNITNLETGNVVEQGTVTGEFGRYVVTVEVANSTTNHTWQVQWDAARQQDDGTDKTISGTDFAGDVPNVPLPVDPRWLSLIGYVAVVAIGGLVVQVDAVLGALAATGAGSVLTVLGIISIPVPALALAGGISFIALIGRQR